MWQLKPFSTYKTKSQKITHFFSNNTKCCDLRTFAEIFWPRKAVARKSLDFWDSGNSTTRLNHRYFWTDFLRENSFAQSQCSYRKFCAETCVKNYIKNKTNSKNMDMLLQTHTEFPVLHSLVRKLRILQIFSQLCDCMLAAFRNSAFEQMKRRTQQV